MLTPEPSLYWCILRNTMARAVHAVAWQVGDGEKAGVARAGADRTLVVAHGAVDTACSLRKNVRQGEASRAVSADGTVERAQRRGAIVSVCSLHVDHDIKGT